MIGSMEDRGSSNDGALPPELRQMLGSLGADALVVMSKLMVLRRDYGAWAVWPPARDRVWTAVRPTSSRPPAPNLPLVWVSASTAVSWRTGCVRPTTSFAAVDHAGLAPWFPLLLLSRALYPAHVLQDAIRGIPFIPLLVSSARGECHRSLACVTNLGVWRAFGIAPRARIGSA